MIRTTSAAAGCFVALICRAALAQEGSAAKHPAEEPFGQRGVINIASDLELSAVHTSYSSPSGPSPDASTSYAIGPAADFFILDNVSVGGKVAFRRLAFEGSATNVFSLGPRVGYHIPLVPERLGVWPRAELVYSKATTETEGAPDRPRSTLTAGVFAPILLHPVEHFHLGFGPFFETDLSAKAGDNDAVKETSIGLRLEIAGWWKL